MLGCDITLCCTALLYLGTWTGRTRLNLVGAAVLSSGEGARRPSSFQHALMLGLTSRSRPTSSASSNDEIHVFCYSDFFLCLPTQVLVGSTPAGPSSAAKCSSWSKSGPDGHTAAPVACHGLLSAVPAPACCTATANMPLHRRAKADVAARRKTGGVRWARKRTKSRSSRCGPPALSSGYVAWFACFGHAKGHPVGLSCAWLRVVCAGQRRDQCLITTEGPASGVAPLITRCSRRLSRGSTCGAVVWAKLRHHLSLAPRPLVQPAPAPSLVPPPCGPAVRSGPPHPGSGPQRSEQRGSGRRKRRRRATCMDCGACEGASWACRHCPPARGPLTAKSPGHKRPGTGSAATPRGSKSREFATRETASHAASRPKPVMKYPLAPTSGAVRWWPALGQAVQVPNKHPHQDFENEFGVAAKLHDSSCVDVTPCSGALLFQVVPESLASVQFNGDEPECECLAIISSTWMQDGASDVRSETRRLCSPFPDSPLRLPRHKPKRSRNTW